MSFQIAQAGVDFKTNRIEQEYEQLKSKNKELFRIVEFADRQLEFVSSKNVVITEIYRTQAEQDRYYRGKKKFRSRHQDWLAVDIRSRHLNLFQISTIIDTINNVYGDGNFYTTTAFYHDMGLGKHIHIQFKEK